MKRFTIWWSPVGAPNGSRVIEAATKGDAENFAFDEMRKHGMCGAWGAVPAQEGEE